MIDIAAHFGDNLARCRRRADLSQDELSVRASLHRTEVSQLERGLRLCRVDTLVKLAGSLEVPADDLLVGINWSPGDVRRGGFVEPRGNEAASKKRPTEARTKTSAQTQPSRIGSAIKRPDP